MRWLVLFLLLGCAMTDIYEQPEDAQPLTLSPDSLVDAWGDPRFSDVDDPDQESWTGSGPAASVGPSLQTSLTSGLVNADFLAGPPDASAHIGDENRLPGWSWVVAQGGGIFADWVDDSASPSGKAITWTVVDAASSDEAYIEQVAPISPRQRLRVPEMRLTQPTAASTSFFIRLQFLTVDGSTTGSEVSGSATMGVGSDPQTAYAPPTAIPSNARYMRIRVGLKADGGTIASESVTLREVFAGDPNVIYETYVTTAVALPGTGTQDLGVGASNSDGAIASGLERYLPVPIVSSVVAPTGLAWVESVRVRLSTPRTAGSVTFQARDVNGGASYGPIATIDGTNTQLMLAVGGPGANNLPFGAHLKVRATGSSFTPTTADAIVWVTVGYVIGY